MIAIPWLGALLLIAGVVVVIRMLRKRAAHRWLIPYLCQASRRSRRPQGQIHLLLCLADHFEPKCGGADSKEASARVQRWLSDYPRLFGHLRDSDGRPPRHTFFFPLEQYEPEYLDGLAQLCRAGFGEVEIHLHHDGDTAENLRETLLHFKELFATEHGLLCRDRDSQELAYGFIHGNWALDNSHPLGRWCGVNNEVSILQETGCYADFTLPSAPSPTQTRRINSIYYAVGRPGCAKSHDWGVEAQQRMPGKGLMLIQGPLVLGWGLKRFLLPSIENGCIQASQPPRLERLSLWLKANVKIRSRPDWFFVKLHTHGAEPGTTDVLLSQQMVRFHEQLHLLAEEDPCFQFHYLTARELFNLAKAAEAGWRGTVDEARDYRLVWNGGETLQLGGHDGARRATCATESP